jgi:three-Cys-motif partner protein
MTTFWGDESWQKIAYTRNLNLFGDEYLRKEPNRVVAEAFRDRLKRIAGFNRVPEPVPMRNRNNAIVCYLVFASHKSTAENIVLDIFKKYRDRGLR